MRAHPPVNLTRTTNRETIQVVITYLPMTIGARCCVCVVGDYFTLLVGGVCLCKEVPRVV